VVQVLDIIKIMEKIAPPDLSEDWDNSGLQVGAYSWEVKKILTALDASSDVIESACKNNVDMLIVHHPFIFSGIKSLNFDSKIGSLIYKAAKNKLSIFSAHTNLDKVENGLNDLLAKKIGLTDLKVLKKDIKGENVKLVFFVPEEFEEKMLNVLFKINAGIIENYSCCSFRNKGIGTFKPNENAKPFLGESGKISHEKEIRIEAVLKKKDIKKTISALKSAHPYETMAYDIYPIINTEEKHGFGRIGKLEKNEKLIDLVKTIKKRLELPNLKFCGDPKLEVKTLALCSGSGSSLIKDFLKSGCDAYLSGDIRYHDARDVEASGKAVIDIGHFASEHLVAKHIAERLNKIFYNMKMDVSAETCSLEKEPFNII
jgi:dinuclear metal center YbgI/SA1388 family protein